MAIQNFSTAAGRINKLKGEILAHAVPVEVLGITGQMKQMPKNKGDTVIYRSWLPYGATLSYAQNIDGGMGINTPSANPAAHLVTEGVTPNADVITPRDVSVQLLEYACLYAITDKTFDLYEDDVPAEMKQQTGERMGLLREMIRWGALKAGTNTFYSGGTTMGTVAATITYNFLSKISRSLLANHGKMITKVLGAGPNFATAPVEAGFIVFCHTDCEHDIRQLPDFVPVSKYAQRKPLSPEELGSMGRFRFIVSPELSSTPNVGAAVGALGLLSTGGANIDCYPVVVVAEDAWGDVALRGSNALDPTWIPPGQKDKNDPLGQRGYVGAKFYSAAFIANPGWMATAWVGVTALS